MKHPALKKHPKTGLASVVGALLMLGSQGFAATEGPVVDRFGFTGPAGATAPRNFIWTLANSFTDIDVFPLGMAPERIAFGLNGVRIGVLGNGKAFVWSPDARPVTLHPDDNAKSAALAIDPAGRIAGWVEDATGRQAVIWVEDAMQRLADLAPPPDGVVLSMAHGFGPQGTIFVAVQNTETGETDLQLWSPEGPLVPLVDVDGLPPVSIAAVASDGHAVGQTDSPAPGVAYLRAPDGATRPLVGPDGTLVLVSGVNASGLAVGTSFGDQPSAVLWDQTGQPLDMNTLLGSALPEGMRLIRADAINDAGQIAVYGLATDGGIHLLLLDPVAPDAPDVVPLPAPRLSAQDLGEVYIDLEANTPVQLAISPVGDIAGACSPLAEVCPIRDADLALLDRDITNLFIPGSVPFGTTGTGVPFQPLLSGPVTGAGGGAPAGTGGNGAGGAGGVAPVQVALAPRQPSFKAGDVAPLTGSGGTGAGSGTTSVASKPSPAPPPAPSPVPLPGSAFALLAALGLMMAFGQKAGSPLRRRHNG